MLPKFWIQKQVRTCYVYESYVNIWCWLVNLEWIKSIGIEGVSGGDQDKGQVKYIIVRHT